MKEKPTIKYPIVDFPKEKALELDRFRELDYYAVHHLNLPIELMMENAGLLLAKLVAGFTEKNQKIMIGVGNGNNGGGGLVAARRLAAWGYMVYLDIFSEITKDLPATQLERALKFGVKNEVIQNPDVWVDAYLGFSQRLPLQPTLLETIDEANNSDAIKVSLDIPTGFLGNLEQPYFQVDKILTLAAPKKIIYKLPLSTELFVADLGIPKTIYESFGVEILPFEKSSIIKLKR